MHNRVCGQVDQVQLFDKVYVFMEAEPEETPIDRDTATRYCNTHTQVDLTAVFEPIDCLVLRLAVCMVLCHACGAKTSGLERVRGMSEQQRQQH